MNPVPAVCVAASVVSSASASASASASTVAAASTSSRMATYASTSLSRTTTLATVGGVITRLNGHHGAYALAHPTPNATAIATALASAGLVAASSRPTRAANRPRDDDFDDTVAHPSSSSPFAPATRARALVVRRARIAPRASPRIHRAPSRARCVVLARIGAVATAMTSRTRRRARARAPFASSRASRPRARRRVASTMTLADG